MNIAEITISYTPQLKVSECPKVTCSGDAYDLLLKNWNDDIQLRESFYVMLLNRAHRVKGIVLISAGGVTGTVADLKIIFAVALKTLSCSIIVAHNHPSGNLKPSQADIDLTRKIKEASKYLEVDLLDHIIVTTEG